MNTNSGNDPMLSSLMHDDWGKFAATSSATISSASSKTTACNSSPAFVISMDGLLSPETSLALSDLAAVWSNERKDVLSIKTEEDDRFLVSPYAPSGDIDMDEIDIGSNTTVTDIKSEVEDSEFDETGLPDSSFASPESSSEYNTTFMDSTKNSNYYKRDVNTFPMNEALARRFVEEQFEKIAFVPSSKLSQREKIEFILVQSDCTDYSIENVLNFDKRSPDSARACARIVQNIPQRYRWECVLPEEIPCCYTIVADCKKVCSRDKPPRPMNAFMIWAQGARRLINELCPKMQNALISEALGYYWRQKSDAFKKIFEQEKINLRRFHNVEFPQYKYKPKTKVQKAKEKQELSMTKAKMRASVKRENLHLMEDSNLYHRRTKCGRPRKVKSASCRNEANKPSSSQVVISEKLTLAPCTRPAIKDMLTLKILGDRRSKGANKIMPKSKVVVESVFGQLSPLETGSPYVSDMFEDLDNVNKALVSHADIEKGSSGHVIPSSVYDTPANTPPVDRDDELRLSPLQQQSSSSSSPPTTTKEQTQNESCSKSSDASYNNNILISPVSASHVSPPSTVHCARNNQRQSFGIIHHNYSTISTNTHTSAISTNQNLEFSDLLFTYVTEALSSGPTHSKYINSTSDIDNSCKGGNMGGINRSDDNNNNVDTPISVSANVMNIKSVSSFYEPCDLDTLCLDLSCPVLTDDDMRSLLNSL